ncbi:MAG: hypothetical protein QNL62_21395 [Gammaproteobacteria bacterium]|nr:hypothetical protein [Gammaproteobacteria bacterium]
MLWRITAICCIAFSLLSCQTSAPFIPADVIIADAHGGGSVIDFNNSETILASGGWSGYIRLWKMPDGTKHAAWKAHKGEVTSLHFTGNDKLLISSGYDGFIKIWSTSTGKLVKQINTLHTIHTTEIDELRNLIISGHINGMIRIWRLTTLSPLKQRKQHNSPVKAIAFHDNIIASSGSGGDVMLWPGSAPSSKLPSPFSAVRSLSFAENGRILLGGGWFNLYRWTLNENKLQVLDTEHRGIIRNMQLLDNDSTLATISRQTDSAVLFLDPQTGAVKQRFQSHDLCGVDVTVSRHQKFLATTSDDASVRIWWLHKLPETEPSDSGH